MKHYFLILPLIILFSCQSKDNPNNKIDNRDTLLRQYIRVTDSIPWTDTIDPRRKFLKAYYRNDISYLKRSVEEVQDLLKDLNKETQYYIACNSPEGIDTYNFKEAYRFQYGAAFCNQSVNITIGQRNDSTYMISYHYLYNDTRDSCLSSTRSEKYITNKQWEAIQEELIKADFWGLKTDNGRHGMDGSMLTVTGYKKPIYAVEGHYSIVGRWAAERTALGETFKLVLDLSDVKVPCFHY